MWPEDPANQELRFHALRSDLFGIGAALVMIIAAVRCFMGCSKLTENKLDRLPGRFLDDFGAVFHGAMVVIGDKQ
jgi:hypothetical protein